VKSHLKKQHPPRKSHKPSKLTRRQALKAAGLGLGFTHLAFSGGCDSMLGPMPAQCKDGPLPADPTPTSTMATSRQLLSGVDHIVVVVMENRSFDHFLGALAYDTSYPAAKLIDGLKGNEGNPDATGQMVMSYPLKGRGTMNPLHSWVASRLAFNGGLNDGFVRANVGRGDHTEVMSHLEREQLPFFHELASQSVVCDRWFSSVMGPTWPNRFYVHAGTSHGQMINRPMGLGAADTIWDRLAERCYTGKNYYAGAVPWYSAAFPTKSFSGNDAMTPEPIEGFFRDAASGNLPHFTLIDPDYQLNDGHATSDLTFAEAFLSSVHRALVNGPKWSRTMFVVTFDEHGGYFDHVAPPQVTDDDPRFGQLGFRVPALVTGPMVRAGTIVSTPFEHVSIAATLRARFGLRSLNQREEAANDLSVCIDQAFAAQAARSTSASLLPAVDVSAAINREEAIHETSQPEIEALARAGGVPEHHIDTRASLDRVRSWLRHAQELEAVRVIG
jgi:phospholipase C